MGDGAPHNVFDPRYNQTTGNPQPMKIECTGINEFVFVT